MPLPLSELFIAGCCRKLLLMSTYLQKKRAEGKHYNVAISHAEKKLVRLIYAMEKTGKTYTPAA